MKKYAIIASFVELDQISSLNDYEIITFKKSISNSLNMLNVDHAHIFTHIYNNGKMINKVLDILRIWRIFTGCKLLVFVNHDCLATALSIKFARSVVFKNKYPHVDLSGDNRTLPFSIKVLSVFFGLKIELKDDHGLLVKSFDKLIISKAKTEPPYPPSGYHLHISREPALVFICDDNFCRNKRYKKDIETALGIIQNRYPNFELLIKYHPKNSIASDINFTTGNIVPNDLPVEALIRPGDILIGLYSSVFERIKDNKIISILNQIEPKCCEHEFLKKNMKYRMDRIKHEAL